MTYEGDMTKFISLLWTKGAGSCDCDHNVANHDDNIGVSSNIGVGGTY